MQRVTCAHCQAIAVTALTTACCIFVSVGADDSAGGVRYGISVSVSCDRPDAPELEARKFVRAHIEYVETLGASIPTWGHSCLHATWPGADVFGGW